MRNTECSLQIVVKYRIAVYLHAENDCGRSMFSPCRTYNSNDISLPLQRWPEAQFNIVHDAGHSEKEQGISSLLVKAAEKYAQL